MITWADLIYTALIICAYWMGVCVGTADVLEAWLRKRREADDASE